MRENQVLQAEIDRLVEGELSKRELRELIHRLDGSPDGWRRCALAFLEQRTWRQAFQGLLCADEQVAEQRLTEGWPTQRRIPSNPISVGGPRRQHALVGRLGWTGLVAAVLLALVVGFSLGRRPTGIDVLRNDPPLAREDSSHGETGQPSNPDVSPQMPPSMHLVGEARLDGAELPQNSSPVFAGPGLDEQWVRNRPAIWSDYEREQLLRRGLRVFEKQQLVTVELADGRKLSIPIDLVGYQFVPQRVF